MEAGSYVACRKIHPATGLMCSKSSDHLGEHIAWDNSRDWKGTPGVPVKWLNGNAARETSLLSPTHVSIPSASGGLTGSMCSTCGSSNMRRNGSCEVCGDCGETTGCS